MSIVQRLKAGNVVAAGGSDRLNTSSPFNIKVRSLTLRNFNAKEVAELYNQHTEDRETTKGFQSS